jgi:hypothetical protein
MERELELEEAETDDEIEDEEDGCRNGSFTILIMTPPQTPQIKLPHEPCRAAHLSTARNALAFVLASAAEPALIEIPGVGAPEV